VDAHTSCTIWYSGTNMVNKGSSPRELFATTCALLLDPFSSMVVHASNPWFMLSSHPHPLEATLAFTSDIYNEIFNGPGQLLE